MPTESYIEHWICTVMCEIIFCINNKAIVLTFRDMYGFRYILLYNCIQNSVQVLLRHIQITVSPETDIYHIVSSKLFFIASDGIQVVLMKLCHQNLANIGGRDCFLIFYFSHFCSALCKVDHTKIIYWAILACTCSRELCKCLSVCALPVPFKLQALSLITCCFKSFAIICFFNIYAFFMRAVERLFSLIYNYI